MRQVKSIRDLPVGTLVQLKTWESTKRDKVVVYNGIVSHRIGNLYVEIYYSDGEKITYNHDHIDDILLYIVEVK